MIKRIIALLVLAAGSIQAEVDMAFTDCMRHLQTDIESTQYLGGAVFARVQDGNIGVVGCFGNGGYQFYGPQLGCPLGTTGFIAQGDVGNAETGEPIPDGIPDQGTYWSVAVIIEAILIEPFQLDRVRIVSAPPSGIADLLRGNDGDAASVFAFTDDSAAVWFNYVTFPVRNHEVAIFRMARDYGVVPRTNQWVDLLGDTFAGDDLPDQADVMANPPVGDPLHTVDIPVGDPMLRVDTIYSGSEPFNFAFTVPETVRSETVPDFLDDEEERQYYDVPKGPYIFGFPALGSDTQEVYLGVTLIPFPDVYPGRGHVRNGIRMTNETWYENALEVDPRVFYDFQWTGIGFDNAVVSDEIHLSMRANQWVDLQGNPRRTLWVPDMADVMPNDGSIPDIAIGEPMYREDVMVFPPYPIQTLLTHREEFQIGLFENHYELGPFFFTPGDSTMQRIDLRRNLKAGGSTRDTSRRFLDCAITFIDTYEGFSFFSAPLIPGGFPLGTRTSEREPNGDFDSDGYSNLMEFAFMSDVADPTSIPNFRFDLGDQGGGVGSCLALVRKRPNVGSSLTYQFEYSSDGMQTWILIEEGGIWDIFENDTILRVINTAPIPGDSCFIRVRVSQ